MATSTEQQDTLEKEAHEYWGYLFKSDKTGTDKLKKLLRALYRHIGTKYDPHDSTDLVPAQLAHFYRDLNGNYDPLFLSVQPSTIAFIYKNLGCLHSLQPLPTSAAERRFTDPSIPALKLEGWIMWETIQLLLGPDEHAGFLIAAVKKWELLDPDTGISFPTTLSRSSFPAAPDPHMTAWYEGLSERLRREAEQEQSMRITNEEDESQAQIESGQRGHRKHHKETHHESEEEASIDSKKSSALAYFRNPLFRNSEGRPGVIRRDSKHPTLVSRGKSAATSVGHVVRNIGSPYLWEGGEPKEKEKHKHRDRSLRDSSRHHHDRESERISDRDRRRKSMPHHHYLTPEDEGGASSPRGHPRKEALQSRRGSQPNSPASDRDGYESNVSHRHNSGENRHHRQHSSPDNHTIRHSKSHEPTSSAQEYFPPYDTYNSRRGSAHTDVQSPGGTSTSGRTPAPEGSREYDILHQGFMPTASPLFATQIARSEIRSATQFRPQDSAPRSSNKEQQDSPISLSVDKSPSRKSGAGDRRRDNASQLGKRSS